MGLDLGTKVWGVAIADRTRTIASPREGLPRTKLTQDAQKLKKIIDKEDIKGVVVGLPRNMDGSLGPKSQAARDTAKDLVKLLERPVLLWDERLSTVAVTNMMLEADLSRQKRDKVVDKLAACYILQNVLDALEHLTH